MTERAACWARWLQALALGRPDDRPPFDALAEIPQRVLPTWRLHLAPQRYAPLLYCLVHGRPTSVLLFACGATSWAARTARRTPLLQCCVPPDSPLAVCLPPACSRSISSSCPSSTAAPLHAPTRITNTTQLPNARFFLRTPLHPLTHAPDSMYLASRTQNLSHCLQLPGRSGPSCLPSLSSSPIHPSLQTSLIPDGKVTACAFPRLQCAHRAYAQPSNQLTVQRWRTPATPCSLPQTTQCNPDRKHSYRQEARDQQGTEEVPAGGLAGGMPQPCCARCTHTVVPGNHSTVLIVRIAALPVSRAHSQLKSDFTA